MEQIHTIENYQNNGILILSKDKNTSFQFLNKKRSKSDTAYNEEKFKFIEDLNLLVFTPVYKIILEKFLDNYSRIINDPNLKNKKYIIQEKKEFFDTSFNLKLTNTIFNYFSKEKSKLRNANFFNCKDLIDLIKTYLINEFQFSILTLLIDRYISKDNLSKENIYYLGLYTKYISSDTYSEVFNWMIKSNIFFKNWYLRHKQFLESIDTSVININNRINNLVNKNHTIEEIDFNSMVDNIIFSKKENKIINNFKPFNSNIGKKIHVEIVYQEESSQSQENLNSIETRESSHKESEALQIPIFA